MAKKIKATPQPNEQLAQCPKCGSGYIGGLMAAFYVSLGADGTPKDDWQHWSSESELGTERICYNCNHEWKL